ncbi:LysR family transcriptional regulator [Paraburkholderia sp. BR10936]|uniref:LysR family transcriptional regulator n=1 Tax=Paraburkholderia sp. BR10936 TaxID=3236993 RepID=UPI0034D370DA
MNLRQLEHVVALAEEGSFARAAQRVHLSQPALSRSIQSIEEELGMALFDRTTRDVQITSAGETVVRRAKKVLFEARCLVRDVDLLRDHSIGSVSFGAGPYPAAMLLPAVLDNLAQQHPQMRIDARIDNWKNSLESLYSEELDFLIVDIRGAPTVSEVNVIPLPRHRAGWYVREGHPLARLATVETHQLQAFPVISVPLPDAMRDGLRKWLRYAPGNELDFHLVCNDVNVLQEYARKTDALLLLTTHAFPNASRMADLVPLSLPSRKPLWLQFCIIHLAGRTLSPAAEQAIRVVQEVAAAHYPYDN